MPKCKKREVGDRNALRKVARNLRRRYQTHVVLRKQSQDLERHASDVENVKPSPKCVTIRRSLSDGAKADSPENHGHVLARNDRRRWLLYCAGASAGLLAMEYPTAADEVSL